ncbi:hypothetical protein P7C70_g5228, partial [Phenoliferia sp. Uapishka_3]
MLSSAVLLTLALSFSLETLASPYRLNKVLKSRACASVELIHAAGTTESGLGVVGQPLSEALGKSVSSLSTYSLPCTYPLECGAAAVGIVRTDPCTDADYTSTVSAGATLMQQRVASTLSSCPDTVFILSGYSKGAMVVHHTASVLTAAQKSAVHGVAVFGDPDRSPKGVAAIENLANSKAHKTLKEKPQAEFGLKAWPIDDPSVESVGADPSTGTNVFSACVTGDEFCDGGGFVGLAYSSNGDVTKAAAFLAGLVV